MNDERVDELITLARAGDADAFGALYEHYAVRVYRYLLAHVAEPADAEDLLHRVFVKVIEALPRYESRGLPFGAWLFRIARNALIDFDRRDRPSAPIEALSLRPDEGQDPTAFIESAEERAALLAALDGLTDEQRDVLLYRFFAGLSPAEIGALMGKREGSVRALQFRALSRLRDSEGVRALRADGLVEGSA